MLLFGFSFFKPSLIVFPQIKIYECVNVSNVIAIVQCSETKVRLQYMYVCHKMHTLLSLYCSKRYSSKDNEVYHSDQTVLISTNCKLMEYICVYLYFVYTCMYNFYGCQTNTHRCLHPCLLGTNKHITGITIPDPCIWTAIAWELSISGIYIVTNITLTIVLLL